MNSKTYRCFGWFWKDIQISEILKRKITTDFRALVSNKNSEQIKYLWTCSLTFKATLRSKALKSGQTAQDNVVVAQAWGTEFSPQNWEKNPDIMTRICDPT